MEDSVASPPIASDIVSEPSSPADESRFNDESRFKWEDSRESSLEPLDGDDTQKFTQHADKPVRGKSRASQGKDPNAQQIGKIKHLKKEDGEPLWRKDIQHDFLRAIFDNDQKVFTNSYEPQDIGKQCFADLYIDTMSRSTKTSKVLRDKLLSDREAAKGMAMVCLLVNMGRMNTTLNFFPEMRAQLRTYHAIPSLQAHQDPHAYKQLQDAPRLKSILKGGAEDREEPTTLEKIKAENIPRTNPVNLIFIMCNTAQKIAELHFPARHEFHDLIMKTHYSSQSRAMAFLWLMWFYLESDFTEEGCDENPFGPGVDYGLDVANQGVPQLVKMTPETQALENVDTEEEIEFGRSKQKTRAKILEMDQAYLNERETKRGKVRVPISEDGPAILPRIRPSKHESDMDSTRSTPPPRALARSGAAGSTRRGAPLKYQIFEGSSPAHHATEGVVARKPRPPTAHQLAVERNRSQRVEYILDRGLRRRHHKSRKLRRQNGAVVRAYKRIQAQIDPFADSENESEGLVARNHSDSTGPFRERGLYGLALMVEEEDDFGEEVSSYAAAIRRSARRLGRWYGHESELGVVAPIKRPKQKSDVKDDMMEGADADDMMSATNKLDGEANGDATMDDIEMDEADQTIMAEDDGDDADKTEIMGDSDRD